MTGLIRVNVGEFHTWQRCIYSCNVSILAVLLILVRGLRV